MRLFSTIQSSLNNIEFSPDIIVPYIYHYRSGGYILGPTSIEYNGNYYGTGQSLIPEERGIIWKFNPVTDVFEHDEIYGATPNPELIQHRFPSIVFDDNGYIIAAATDPHNGKIRVYKSDSPEDITAFTNITTNTGNTSYPCLTISGNDLIIWFRFYGTGSGVDWYVGAIWKLNLVSLVWERLLLIQNASTGDTDRRIYNVHPRQKVNNSWEYLLCNQRMGNAGTEEYSAQFVLKTHDFNTFYNIEETWSKNVTINGIITEAERVNVTIRDNGPLKGVGLHQVSIVNDVFVGYYYDWDAGEHYLQWYDGSWNTKNIQTLLNPLYGYDGGVDGIYKLGEYYYIFVFDTDLVNTLVYKSKIPFETFEQVFNVYQDSEGINRSNSILPVNVATEQKSILLGSRTVEQIMYNIVNF